MKHAIELRGMRVVVGGRTLLDGIDLIVEPGTSAAITGPSGSGKSTLLACLAALTQPDEGHLIVGGVDLLRLSARRRAAWRLATLGFVYQFGELLPELTPSENVVLPALLGGGNRAGAYEQAHALLGSLGVASVAESPTDVLSGGERQRVAVARALITKPEVVLADEPTGSLDESSVEQVAEILFALPRQQGCALVLVTHNERVAERADEVYQLSGGKLVGR